MMRFLRRFKILKLIRNLVQDFRIFFVASIQRPLLYHLHEYKDVRGFDNDLLVFKIKHPAHLLEKCTKNNYVAGAGVERREYLGRLLEEAQHRVHDEAHIVSWAQNIARKYDLWQSDKKQILDPQIPEPEGKFSRYRVKSVRFWKNKDVPRELIDDCVLAAREASASCNRQAFKAAVLTNKDEIFFGEAHNRSMFAKAPARVFIFVDHRCYSELYSPAIDVGMFIQNFVLRAKEIGLNTCCCYGSEHLDPTQEQARKIFGLPSHYYCYVSILVGYGDETPLKPPRRELKDLTIYREKGTAYET